MPKGKRLIPIKDHKLGSVLFRYANIEYKLRQKQGQVKWISCVKVDKAREAKSTEPPKMLMILPGSTFTTMVEEPRTMDFSDPCA